MWHIEQNDVEIAADYFVVAELWDDSSTSLSSWPQLLERGTSRRRQRLARECHRRAIATRSDVQLTLAAATDGGTQLAADEILARDRSHASAVIAREAFRDTLRAGDGAVPPAR